jgi:LacI family transcriptional regulator, galactose operon repressor
MPTTIKEVSQLAEMAASTVSYVLNGKGDDMNISGKTQKKILSAAKKLNYRANLVAKSLRKQKTHSIGVVMHDLTSSWANEIMEGINEELLETGYHPLLAVNFWNTSFELQNIQTFLDSRVEGLIIQPNPANMEYYSKLLSSGDIPINFIGDTVSNVSTSAFMLDAYSAGVDQIDFLAKYGHRRIAVITVDHPSYQTRMRVRGALDRIQQLGLEFPIEYLRTTKLAQPDYDKSEAQALGALKTPPTAIAVTNDTIAYRIMSGLHAMGNTGIAVMGIGDLPESSYDMIGLTSIVEPRRDIGRWAAKSIVRALSGDGQERSKLFKGKIIVRKSTLNKTGA